MHSFAAPYRFSLLSPELYREPHQRVANAVVVAAVELLHEGVRLCACLEHENIVRGPIRIREESALNGARTIPMKTGKSSAVNKLVHNKII